MKILLVKTSAIGDVVQTFPVLEYLRRKFPEAIIDWVVEKPISDLVASHPHLNHVLIVDTKKWRKTLFSRATWKEIKNFRKKLQKTQYDLLFDLQGNSKSGLFTWMARSVEKIGYGFKSLPEKINGLVTNRKINPPIGMNIRLQYLHLVQSYFQDDKPFDSEPIRLKTEVHLLTIQKPNLMVCFGSRWKNKQLSPETLLKLLEKIDAKYRPQFLFVYGNEEEKNLAKQLSSSFKNSKAIGDLSLQQLQNLMFEVDGIISMDSATLHLCASTGTPSFTIFGPSTANAYKPIGEQHHFFQGQCPYGKKFPKRCPILRTCSTGACMRDLSAEELFQAFEDWFINR